MIQDEVKFDQTPTKSKGKEGKCTKKGMENLSKIEVYQLTRTQHLLVIKQV